MSNLDHIENYFIPKYKLLIENQSDQNEFLIALISFYVQVIEYVTDHEAIQFSTLFSRIAFLKSKYRFSGKEISVLHSFRVVIENKSSIISTDELKNQAQEACEVLIHHLSEGKWPRPTIKSIDFISKDSDTQFKGNLFGLIRRENQSMYFIPKDNSSIDEFIIDFKENLDYKNQLSRFFSLGYEFLHVSIIGSIINEKAASISFASVVINPNHLLDVTSIAEVFKGQERLPQSYLAKKFLPVPQSNAIVLGNIANKILDELIQNAEIDLKDVFRQLFKDEPLQFVSFENKTLHELLDSAKHHYLNLKKVLFKQLPQLGIFVNKCYTEPSFLSNTYGIQGRLDVLYQTDDYKQNNIIELKSGSAFGANAYGIAKNHYVQTLLYDLMISSSYGKKANASNYILYSKLNDNSLRYAPTVKQQQLEAIKVRNDLLFIENILQRLDDDLYFSQFKNIISSANKISDRFVSRDIDLLNRVIDQLDEEELSFFRNHVAFISREYSLSKVGRQDFDSDYGFANLWMKEEEEKIDQFTILSKLTISENASFEAEPIVRLKKSEQSNKLSKFRQGDIVILYPYDNASRSALKNQLFKANIIGINNDEISIKLRNHQYNQRVFEQFDYWNIEADFLDSGYSRLLKNIFIWAKLAKDQRQLSLGFRQPKQRLSKTEYNSFKDATEQQVDLLNDIISAEEYFLLWGPPGTGKTSIVIRELSKYYWTHKKPILLLAYTNRAVDEICHAINSINDEMEDQFIRIGSKYSCAPQFRPNLIQEISVEYHKRSSLRDRLESCNIYVATVSSILSKESIFDLINFECIVIDEASQLLAPMILPLFSKSKKLVLVGDHQQLPAVVQQANPNKTVSDNSKGSSAQLNCHLSLFEILFTICNKKQWNENFGTLTLQGRMHQKIMSFPSSNFYDGKLNLLPGIDRIQFKHPDSDGFYDSLLNKRVVFMNSEIDPTNTDKTNRFEANAVLKIIESIQSTSEISSSDIGIITPFRAQIALIDQLISAKIEDHDIIIDTVERFQGSAKDVILFSMCTNDAYHFDRRIQMDPSTVDRKFNVAITRARELLIIIGNEKVLSRYPLYKNWVDLAEKIVF